MKSFDVRKIHQSRHLRTRIAIEMQRNWLESLKVGSPVAIRELDSDAEVTSNGYVVAIEDGAIWAQLPRINHQPTTVLELQAHIELPRFPRLKRAEVVTGAWIEVVENWGAKGTCMISGQIDEVDPDSFHVHAECIPYTGRRATARVTRIRS